jgi:hypothetical protein
MKCFSPQCLQHMSVAIVFIFHKIQPYEGINMYSRNWVVLLNSSTDFNLNFEYAFEYVNESFGCQFAWFWNMVYSNEQGTYTASTKGKI